MKIWDVRNYADVREVYERLLVPSFPRDELRDPGTITRLWREGLLDMVVAADADDNPGAVAVGLLDDDSDVVLLNWLAVAPSLRGQGVGQELLRTALQRWQDRWDPRLILGEVEHPATVSHEPDHGDPRARQRFYARFHPRVLDVPYFQPRMRLTGHRVPRMMLVCFYDAAPGSRQRVESAPVRLWLGRVMNHEPRDAARERLFASVADEFVETMPMDAPDNQLPSDGGLALPTDHRPLPAQVMTVGLHASKGVARAIAPLVAKIADAEPLSAFKDTTRKAKNKAVALPGRLRNRRKEADSTTSSPKNADPTEADAADTTDSPVNSADA